MAQESIHEDIKWLEKQLEAKKQELIKGGESKEEKAVLRDVISEAQVNPPVLLSSGQITDDAAQQAAYGLKEKEHAQIVEDLVSMAIAKGLGAAMKVANSLRNPHILDEFHDILADKYYEKLIEARKIKT